MKAEEGSRLELLRLSAPLSHLPWDIAQDEFGPVGSDFIAHLGRVLLRAGQDERGTQARVSIRKIGPLPQRAAQDERHL